MDNEPNNLSKCIDSILVLMRNLGIHIENIETGNYGFIIKNLLFMFLSKYKFELLRTNDESNYILDLINSSLKMLNSKYLIVENYNMKGFCYIFVYFMIEFDIINDYIEYTYKQFKKLNLVRIDFLFKFTEKILEKEENTKKDYNLLMIYNKINMSIKNIKKQVDLFINLTFKLNKLASNSEMIKSTKTTLKIEEFILFHDKIFEQYLELTEESSQKYEEYFIHIEKIIQKLTKLVDLSVFISIKQLKAFDNMTLDDSQINHDYVIDNKNNQIKKVRKIFSSFLKIDQKYTSTIENWVIKLQDKLNIRLVSLKEKQESLLKGQEMKDFLTNLASRLEEYFEENVKDLSDIVFSPEILTKIKNFMEGNKTYPDDDYVGFDKYHEHVSKKFDSLLKGFDDLNKKILEKLKLSYDIYNS